VAHLDVKSDLVPLRIKYGINDRLPPDISILNVEEADSKFHARHDAVARSYIYQISQRRTAFGKKYVWWIKDILDSSRMEEAAGLFTGLHDYSSFTDPEQEQNSTRVKVLHASVKRHSDMILIHIIGSHFLWKQVRRMTGVLVETGRGNLSAGDVSNFLRNRSDAPAKLTAPPSGLFLEKVYYRGEKFETEIMPVIKV
jgi:tRNA pseudouridine38-40 synthase